MTRFYMHKAAICQKVSTATFPLSPLKLVTLVAYDTLKGAICSAVKHVELNFPFLFFSLAY